MVSFLDTDVCAAEAPSTAENALPAAGAAATAEADPPDEDGTPPPPPPLDHPADLPLLLGGVLPGWLTNGAQQPMSAAPNQALPPPPGMAPSQQLPPWAASTNWAGQPVPWRSAADEEQKPPWADGMAEPSDAPPWATGTIDAECLPPHLLPEAARTKLKAEPGLPPPPANPPSSAGPSAPVPGEQYTRCKHHYILQGSSLLAEAVAERKVFGQELDNVWQMLVKQSIKGWS